MSAAPKRQHGRIVPFPSRETLSTSTDYVPQLDCSDSQVDRNRRFSTENRYLVVGGAAGREEDRSLSAPPTTPTAFPQRRLSTSKPKHVLDALARELRSLGFAGAVIYVRAHPFDLITYALTETLAAIERGEDIKNPPGFVRWLVAEAEHIQPQEDP